MKAAHPSLEKINAAIPHRAPMLLVDEIVEQDEPFDRLSKDISCRTSFSFRGTIRTTRWSPE